MIKKTDKRNAVVIMNKDQYSSEGLRQVDSAYYLKVEKTGYRNCTSVERYYDSSK